MICRGIINAVTIAMRVICAATPASANLPHRTQSPQSPTGRGTPPASSELHQASWRPIRPKKTALASGLLACSFRHLRRTHGQLDFGTYRHTGTTGKHGENDEVADCVIFHACTFCAHQDLTSKHGHSFSQSRLSILPSLFVSPKKSRCP